MMNNKPSLVDDYQNTRSGRYPLRYFPSIENNLKLAKPRGIISKFFRYEVKPILEESIKLTDSRAEKSIIPDILFEYLIVKAITYLEIQLRYHCNLLIKEFPTIAESLLKDRDKTKKLSIQILSNYSFSNLKDIHHVFSTLLGKDFFQLLRHRSEECASIIGLENDHIYRASPLFKNWKMFEKLFELRNELVHDNKRIIIKSKKLRKNLLTTVYDVVYLLDFEYRHRPYNKNSFTKLRYSY